MRITSRFTIAVHAMLCITYFSAERRVTSDFIASSVTTNPVVIRRIMGQLKDTGLIRVDAGVGGAYLSKDAKDITLLDIFRAVECVDGDLFHFHENPCDRCPVGHNIHNVLDDTLSEIQSALEQKLSQTTMQDLAEKMVQSIAQNPPNS